MGVIHLAFLLIGCAILSVVPVKKPNTRSKRIGRFSLFVILFLVVGSLFNGLWSCLVYGRLYDSADYVFDFVPFWPITWITVDEAWGDGRGKLYTSLLELRLVWFLFATCTWGVTILLYRSARSRLGLTKVPAGTIACQLPG
jgi:hypothetical protein